MKKLLITIIALSLAGGSSFAADYGTGSMKKDANAMMEAAKAFSGKVASVNMADAAKSTKSEIVVTDDMGKKMTFAVQSTTIINDASGQSTTFDKIKTDDKVALKYDVKDGINEASWIGLK